MSTNPNQLQGDVQIDGTLQVENPSVFEGTAPEYVVAVTAQGDPGPVIGREHPGSTPSAAVYASGGKVAIQGSNSYGIALEGQTMNGTGVAGSSTGNGTGVSGTGVGEQGAPATGTGVLGTSTYGAGVMGTSTSGVGVQGTSTSGIGLQGTSTSQVGIYGQSQQSDGISGVSNSDQHSCIIGNHPGAGNGLAGHSLNGYGVDAYSQNGIGLHAVGGTNAAVIDGNMQVNGNETVTGNLQVNANQTIEGTLTVKVDIVLVNQDCAEEFDLSANSRSDPGTVMVLGDEGKLEPSHRPYDKRVVGVISGAGDYRPGLVLGRDDRLVELRAPVALLGKVFCKADASYGAVETGDLLTTSPTLGHAMKATDPVRAFGTIVGKALGDLSAGQGMIPILVAMR